ncbi:MAG: hypothetical protein HOQ02_05660 [Lysobacter sp.]|nr:hypothetical protein [Lysobacter sp.]
MPWIYLLLSAAAFIVAFKAGSTWLMGVMLLIALALLVAFALALLAQRIGSRSRDESAMLDPAELRRLREQAEARRVAAAAEGQVLPNEARPLEPPSP